MTSSTKPEVHNVSQFPRKTATPQPRVIRAENFVKFGLWFLKYARGQTDRHTFRHGHRSTSHTYAANYARIYSQEFKGQPPISDLQLAACRQLPRRRLQISREPLCFPARTAQCINDKVTARRSFKKLRLVGQELCNRIYYIYNKIEGVLTSGESLYE